MINRTKDLHRSTFLSYVTSAAASPRFSFWSDNKINVSIITVVTDSTNNGDRRSQLPPPPNNPPTRSQISASAEFAWTAARKTIRGPPPWRKPGYPLRDLWAQLKLRSRRQERLPFLLKYTHVLFSKLRIEIPVGLDWKYTVTMRLCLEEFSKCRQTMCFGGCF